MTWTSLQLLENELTRRQRLSNLACLCTESTCFSVSLLEVPFVKEPKVLESVRAGLETDPTICFLDSPAEITPLGLHLICVTDMPTPPQYIIKTEVFPQCPGKLSAQGQAHGSIHQCYCFMQGIKTEMTRNDGKRLWIRIPQTLT